MEVRRARTEPRGRERSIAGEWSGGGLAGKEGETVRRYQQTRREAVGVDNGAVGGRESIASLERGLDVAWERGKSTSNCRVDS